MFDWILNTPLLCIKKQRDKLSQMKNLENYGSFLWMAFKSVNALEPL